MLLQPAFGTEYVLSKCLHLMVMVLPTHWLPALQAEKPLYAGEADGASAELPSISRTLGNR